MASLGMDRDVGRLTCSEGVSAQYGPKDKSKPSMKPPHRKDSWIYRTFKKRSCVQFIPSGKETRRCCCGLLDKDHQGGATRGIPGGDVKWSVTSHTEEQPTNAYGEVEFTGAGLASRAKFIRIAHDTDPEKILCLLREEWRLDLPKLLISVTGGAKNFVLHPKLKYVLRQGLLKAAQTTGAWIITGGTNTGVMRHVGEAVKGHTVMSRGALLSKDKASQLHLIGIATWGIVDHREDLINSQGVVTYHMTPSLLSEGACLDNNHSHFILVDDGTVGKYGGEIPFRASLQNCITTKKIAKSKSHGIPVVLLVLEGGPNTIQTVLESVTSNPAVPVVIAEGSGRAADILAHAHGIVTSNDGTDMEDMSEVVEHQQLRMKIQKAFPECNEEKCTALYHDVLKCVGNKRYITIFRMDEDGIDIDIAILKALLKAQHASAADQLSLALIWNRADIASTEIFKEDQKWKMKSLEDAMMDALVNNRVEFVKLLLENGVSMSRFLTTTRLEELYKARWRSSSNAVLRQLIGNGKIDTDHFDLSDVDNVIRRLLGIAYKGHREKNAITKGLDISNQMMFVRGHTDNIAHVNYPYNELLLWSVLCNMRKMALFMWECGDEHLARALVAGKMFNGMAKVTERDDAYADITDALNAHVEEFKRLALGLLDKCFQENEELTQMLLTYHLENWGGQTCLSLAVAIEHEEFLAHSSCQALLTDIWTGAMKNTHRSSIKTMLGILIPPTIFLLEFKTKQELSSMPVTMEEHEQELAEEGECDEVQDDEENLSYRRSRAITDDGGALEMSVLSSKSRELLWVSTYHKCRQETRVVKLRWARKILEFYKAPVTKFWSNAFAYMAFLMLFSFVILVKADKIPSISEMVLIIFVCTLCTEEIRQILHSEPPTFGSKLKDWASSKWNLLDGFAVVSFFIGLGLRLHPTTRSAGHVVYSLDVMLWIIRLLDIFSVSKHLGPYVVMIGRMTVDMLYFLLIMVIFLLAYGVAQQAILYPNETASWSMVSRVFFRPYFQVYGELFFVDAPDTISPTETVFGTPRKDEHGDTIVVFIMAFYLLVANILLLNLLIAIFNNTFSSVQANANQIWKFQRYYLVMEYSQRPVLVPPFIIFNHVIHALRGLYHWLKNCLGRGKRNQEESSYGLKLFLETNDLQKLMMFEERCVDSYLREKDTLLHATQEEQMRVMGDRMEAISSQLQDMYKDSICQFHSGKKSADSLSKRLNKLEKGMNRILEILAPEPGALTNDENNRNARSGRTASLSAVEIAGVGGHKPLSQRFSYDGPRTNGKIEPSSPLMKEGFKFTRRRLSTAAARAKKALKHEAHEKVTHVHSRHSPYPKSNQQRYPVPDFLVDWQESFPGYDPPLYTAQEVEAMPAWADPDILDPNDATTAIFFNFEDQGINRRSHTGLIDVVNRLPRNPMGRTGIAGRGLFGRWGPNHAVHVVVTRWKIGEDGQVLRKQEKNVLEFVANKNLDSLEWELPGELLEAGDSALCTLKKIFTNKILASVKSDIKEGKENLDKCIDTIVQNAAEVYRGYVDDVKNTDNAWLETTAMHFHDNKREMLGDVEFEDESSICWQEVSSHTNIHDSHVHVLSRVAALGMANF